VSAARSQLRGAGIPDDEAELDARLFAEHVLGWTTEQFLTRALSTAPAEFARRYEALIERRARREPAAYILGRQEFWGLDFEVGPGVLIPRPETELIVESALALTSVDQPYAAADICTGSGCLAAAVALERPRARVTATDVSPDAVAIAARNAADLGVADRVDVHRADLFGDLSGPFDLILANPPYVPDGDRAAMQPEVRDYEPPLALFAGPDGLHVIRRLIVDASPRLRRGGWLIFEFGFGQAGAVSELISRAGALTMIDLRRDLQGIPRTAVAQRT
jgi:release factor glutamine methyltransferase